MLVNSTGAQSAVRLLAAAMVELCYRTFELGCLNIFVFVMVVLMISLAVVESGNCCAPLHCMQLSQRKCRVD